MPRCARVAPPEEVVRGSAGRGAGLLARARARRPAAARTSTARNSGTSAPRSGTSLAYHAAVVVAAGLPRVAGEFERLTLQVRMFLAALQIDVLETLPRVVAEVQAL